MTFDGALGLARYLMEQGIDREEALYNPVIPEEYRATLRERLEYELSINVAPARVLASNGTGGEWLQVADRSDWYYWPTLRLHLLTHRGWSQAATRSLDEATNRILAQLAEPQSDAFDIRGLVIGYVQSGKTANYSALIAKAVDVGYRLVIVLAGIDNGLRRQTQIRLQSELVGSENPKGNSVRLPPPGRQWHLYTTDSVDGDFQPGHGNQATLQGAQPVLLVVKKNGDVLRRLRDWLDEAPKDVRHTLPFLLIDDEADQASIDTRGGLNKDGEYVDPTPINAMIRGLLSIFDKSAYVAYTATPFANILIPHSASDIEVLEDLYPKNFIIDLPKPPGYFGADELFGFSDGESEDPDAEALDVLEDVTDLDIAALDEGRIPDALHSALEDFVLAGAARAMRGKGDSPATMLIHVSHLRAEQRTIAGEVENVFNELRDEWRYHRKAGIYERLRTRWDSFRQLTQTLHPELDRPFLDLETHIGPFFEAVQIKTLNMDTGDVLDYEREPKLKAIAIGGNKLSRGLTLEGLLTSFFVRRTAMYDTLLQMGRWFGFREGYEDLTRLYTTPELQGWFAHLAFVEHRLREDLAVYERLGLTPLDVGMRIWQHPEMQMQVTSRPKRRFASEIQASKSYAGTCAQTFLFPFTRPDDLSLLAERNRLQVIELLNKLGVPDSSLSELEEIPVWKGVSPIVITDFLRSFDLDRTARSISPDLISAYIEKSQPFNELTTWTVAIPRRGTSDRQLGHADWGLRGWEIDQISRSRLIGTDSIGVLTSPADETIGMEQSVKDEVNLRVEGLRQSGSKKSKNLIARECRSPEEGLLLLYPLSRYSGFGSKHGSTRESIYADPDSGGARDLVGLAISFPESRQPRSVEAYVEGSVGWAVVD